MYEISQAFRHNQFEAISLSNVFHKLILITQDIDLVFVGHHQLTLVSVLSQMLCCGWLYY